MFIVPTYAQTSRIKN